MLASVLNSDKAIEVNVQIVRIFTRMREMFLTHKDILLKLEQVERKVVGQDGDIKVIFRYLKELLNPATEPMRKIGFKQKNNPHTARSFIINPNVLYSKALPASTCARCIGVYKLKALAIEAIGKIKGSAQQV